MLVVMCAEEVKMGGCTHKCNKDESPKHNDHACNCGYFWGFGGVPTGADPLPPDYVKTTVTTAIVKDSGYPDCPHDEWLQGQNDNPR